MIKPAIKVAVVNPLNDPAWNDTILSCDNGTIFHSANWAKLITETYGYHPTYFTISDQGTFRGCLPVMEVNSFLTGRRGVCLSFSDYCGAVVHESADFIPLFNSILELGRMSGWRYVEFRGEKFLADELPSKAYAHHVVELTKDERVMYSNLRESTARNIRKAVKEGVVVSTCGTLQAVHEFYRLHCLTRKRQGVPPQPSRFFEKLHEHVISQGFGFIALARKGQVPVAGVICLHFGRNAIYKYGASDASYQHLRANNLVLWEAMKKCASDGLGYFSLGRSDLNNEGLMTFKNGWGANSEILNYYRYDFLTSCFVRDQERNMKVYRELLTRLPVTVLKTIGKVLYPHMG
jgi:hypothetical protein